MTRDLCVQPISPKFHKVCSSAAARGSSKATALKSWSWEYLQVGITSPSKLLSVDLRDDLCIWNGAQILTLVSWWQQEGGRQGVNALLWRVAFTSLPLGYQLPILVVCLLSRYCSRTMGFFWGSTGTFASSWRHPRYPSPSLHAHRYWRTGFRKQHPILSSLTLISE